MNRSQDGNGFDVVAAILRKAGLQHAFGRGGEGGTRRLLDSLEKAGVEVHAAGSPAAACTMAGAAYEVTRRPGAVLAGVGDVAVIAGGGAGALLDREAVLLFTDEYPKEVLSHHRLLDHPAVMAGSTKGSFSLSPESELAELKQAIELALAVPAGPVHIDLPQEVRAAASVLEIEQPLPSVRPDLSQALALLQSARRPVALVGLEASRLGTPEMLQACLDSWRIPSFTTVKATGVIRSGLHQGTFRSASDLDPVLEQADLIIGIGLDPVELLPGIWSYSQPFVQLRERAPRRAVLPGEVAVGSIALMLEALLAAGQPSGDWDGTGLQANRGRRREAALHANPEAGQLLEWLSGLAPDACVVVESGSLAAVVSEVWPATRPRRFLSSNGLEAAGWSLPAAVGASLALRGERVIALMSERELTIHAGELGGIAERCPGLLIVVIGQSPAGWARAAEALGLAATVTTRDSIGNSMEGLLAAGRAGLLAIDSGAGW